MFNEEHSCRILMHQVECDCGEWVNPDDLFTCTLCGKPVCAECGEERHGDWYCKEHEEIEEI